MKCPNPEDWDLLAVEALEREQAEGMLAHARTCEACRGQLEAARRNHIDRVRTYEAFDRDHDALREQLMAALPDEVPQSIGAGRVVRIWHRLGDQVMSWNTPSVRRAAKILAPAACVVIVVAVFFALGQKDAFAAALEHLKQAETVVCRISVPSGFKMQGVEIQSEGKLELSAEHGSRCEMYMNGMLITQYFAPPEGPVLMVQPPTRTYMEMDSSDFRETSFAEQSPEGWLRKLWELADDSATELGSDTIEGQDVVGFKIAGQKLGFAPATEAAAAEAFGELWVGAETQLPVRFLVSVPMIEADSTLRVVFDRFEWDVALEATLFEPELPDDYVKLDVQLARPTEEALLNTLGRISELTGGRYTTTLESVTMLAELRTLVSESAREMVRGLDQQGIVQLGMEISAGGMFYMKLVREGHEPEYFGDSVTAADADQVLLRWTLDDGGARVIYGDLRVETVPAQ